MKSHYEWKKISSGREANYNNDLIVHHFPCKTNFSCVQNYNVLVDISYEQGQCFVEQDVPSDVLHSSKKIDIFQNFSKFISANEIPMQGPV